MENLIRDLNRTIYALEKLGELAPSEQVDEWLDQLFQQKIDLAKANLSPHSQALQPAAQAVRQAANKLERALKHKIPLAEQQAIVQDAVIKLSRLLDSAIPMN